MSFLVDTYECEWKAVVDDPERVKTFEQFVNTKDTEPGIEFITERGQRRPADWPGLDGTLPDKNLFHWRDVRKQLLGMGMPPEGERQPNAAERDQLVTWIENAMTVARQRDNERNGLIRRLTVAQYQNTIRELLKLDEDLTAVLPADGISAEGFANNVQTLALSPLLIEAYFNIAEKALELSMVDPDDRPVIQTFQMELGKGINPTPIADNLILGAGSVLIDKADVVVKELAPDKAFPYTPFSMKQDFQFIEGFWALF